MTDHFVWEEQKPLNTGARAAACFRRSSLGNDWIFCPPNTGPFYHSYRLGMPHKAFHHFQRVYITFVSRISPGWTNHEPSIMPRGYRDFHRGIAFNCRPKSKPGFCHSTQPMVPLNNSVWSFTIFCRSNGDGRIGMQVINMVWKEKPCKGYQWKALWKPGRKCNGWRVLPFHLRQSQPRGIHF